ncbi:hypothetical protein MBVG596_0375 [Mycoplasmopsis bovigenitalium]|uniref:hypothetical protein n=1 Tax=Mycoplasmopsis bovigenitalium TaxID=2112 RepID=UPI00090AC18F|nr:hypothetical protein [Mycoplasmopsis bovigenitalium]BAW18184.1 hypothetical protein MBVG596_0375 [Mycoplasmopsis bovigenitalium]
MSKFELKDLEQYNEDDIFVIDSQTQFKLDTSAHSIFKLQNFLNKNQNFNNLSATLDKDSDLEFLRIMLSEKDALRVVNEFSKKYKMSTILYIVHEMFSFWFKQTTGQDINAVLEAQQTKK